MNNELPTPETDAASMPWYGNKDAVQGDFARKLERERDEAQAKLSTVYRWIERNHPDGFIDSQTHSQNLERIADAWHDKIEAMREAIQEAHAALDGCLKYMLGVSFCNLDLECETMDSAHHALAKLQPFIKQ